MINFRAAHPIKPFISKNLIFTQTEHKNLIWKGISTSSHHYCKKNYVLWNNDTVFNGREVSTETLDCKLKSHSPFYSGKNTKGIIIKELSFQGNRGKEAKSILKTYFVKRKDLTTFKPCCAHNLQYMIIPYKYFLFQTNPQKATTILLQKLAGIAL